MLGEKKNYRQYNLAAVDKKRKKKEKDIWYNNKEKWLSFKVCLHKSLRGEEQRQGE